MIELFNSITEHENNSRNRSMIAVFTFLFLQHRKITKKFCLGFSRVRLLKVDVPLKVPDDAMTLEVLHQVTIQFIMFYLCCLVLSYLPIDMFKQHEKSFCILYNTQKSNYGAVVGLLNIFYLYLWHGLFINNCKDICFS